MLFAVQVGAAAGPRVRKEKVTQAAGIQEVNAVDTNCGERVYRDVLSKSKSRWTADSHRFAEFCAVQHDPEFRDRVAFNRLRVLARQKVEAEEAAREEGNCLAGIYGRDSVSKHELRERLARQKAETEAFFARER